MTRRLDAAVLASACLLVSPAMVGSGSAAETCVDEVRFLTEFMDTANAKKNEVPAESAGESDHPLVLTMADGSTVDMRGETEPARPFESWFGDTIKSKEIEGRIVKAKTLGEENADAACLTNLEKIQIWFEETRNASGMQKN